MNVRTVARKCLRASACLPEDLFTAEDAKLARSPRILDFGVGFGRLAIPRILAGHDVYGVDIEMDDLERGRQALAEAGLDATRFVLIDARGSSPFPDGHLDVIYSEDGDDARVCSDAPSQPNLV